MKNLLLVLFLFLNAVGNAQGKFSFDQYFLDVTLRIDYFHSGDAKSDEFTPDRIYKQGTWAGNPENCIQPFELGTYKVSVFDIATNRIIYTKGFSSIFAEYQTIQEALDGFKRTFHESVLIPCPKKPFRLIVEKRDRYNILSPVYTTLIDPSDYHIDTGLFNRSGDKVLPVVNNGNPHNKVDLVLLAEGYTSDEFEKFSADLKYFTDLLFTVEPYKSHADCFNISGIFHPSEQSGTDEPRQGIYKNTTLGSSFNALDLDRYCLAEDNKSIRDMAAGVPYDAILIMVNKNRYGGGGIYNWQTVFTNNSPWRNYVFLHEFGHAFAGLGDEYFSSSVTYVDVYTAGVEPLEANITSLPDTAHVKWKEFLTPGLKIPTDWGKAGYDSLQLLASSVAAEVDLKIGELEKSGAKESQIEKVRSDSRIRTAAINKQIDDFFRYHPLRDKVGVFEGASYMSKGLYRPTVNSLMHGFRGADRLSYNSVNEHAILSTIHYYTGE